MSKYKNTFGLDITSNAITAVELSYKKNILKVINYGRVELNPGIVEDDSIIIDKAEFKEALTHLMKNGFGGPFTSRDVIISISESKTFAHHLAIPAEKAEDRGFIINTAKDFVPIELTQAVVDYKKIEVKEGKAYFEFVAVQRSIIESLTEALAETGLRVVGIDIGKNSVIRACDNILNHKDGDKLVMDIGEDKTVLSVKTRAGDIYTVNSAITGSVLTEKLIKEMKILASDAQQLLKNRISASEEQNKYTAIKNVFKEELGEIEKKIRELVKIVENREGVNISVVRPVGSFSCVPGLKELLAALFPESEIAERLEYIKLDENTELNYIKAIGLALKAVLPEADNKEPDLLPEEIKEELYSERLAPALNRNVTIITIAITLLMTVFGIFFTKAYLVYDTEAKKAAIVLEKAQNPYLNQMVASVQQKNLLASQAGIIIDEAFPVSLLIEKIDDYNRNGISLLSVVYAGGASGKKVKIRAQTKTRNDTEKFIIALEEDPYFLEVDSPLSNLVGKGEHVIVMDLTVDTDKIKEDFDLMQEEKEKAARSTPRPRPPSARTPDPVLEESEPPAEDEDAPQEETEDADATEEVITPDAE